MTIPPKWYQFLVGLFASIGSFNFGYDLGIIAQVVASDSFVSKFNPTDNEKYRSIIKSRLILKTPTNERISSQRFSRVVVYRRSFLWILLRRLSW